MTDFAARGSEPDTYAGPFHVIEPGEDWSDEEKGSEKRGLEGVRVTRVEHTV